MNPMNNNASALNETDPNAQNTAPHQCSCGGGGGGCGGQGSQFKEFETMSMAQLITHIEKKHHQYLKRVLPEILQKFERVAELQGQELPVLEYLLGVYDAFKEEMERHMLKEEEVLFPTLRVLEISTALPELHYGSVMNPIQSLFQDHRGFDSLIGELQKKTANFTAPQNSPRELVELMESMKELVKDTIEHSQLEDQVLFNKAALKEKSLSERSAN